MAAAEVRVVYGAGFSRGKLADLVRIVEARRDDIVRHGMSTSTAAVRFEDVTMWVELTDGRTVGVPLAWFPRLLHVTPEQRVQCRIGVTGQGLHREELDEDISVAGLLAGRGDMTVSQPAAAA